MCFASVGRKHSVDSARSTPPTQPVFGMKRDGRFPKRYASRDLPSASDGEVHSKQAASSGETTRGHQAGFRFGSQEHAPCAATNGKVTSIEAGITETLLKAKAVGPDEIRKALKKLLLRWHPDKALRGDCVEAATAQAESTRILRFILE